MSGGYEQMAVLNSLLQEKVEVYASRSMPVLARSIAELTRFRGMQETVNPREVAETVLRDPMLTLMVLRYLQTHRSQRRFEDIMTVEHAIMMLGLQRFFAAFEKLHAVEEELGGEKQALSGLMQVVGRARTAAIYAGTFATLRSDLQGDQVIVAALLHDMAEMLLWCFDTEQAATIARRMHSTPGLRSADAQQDVLGFKLLDLQLALVRHWGLPELLLSLMDDAHAERPRVRNVVLSTALSRHAWSGWTNPALPDDYENISGLLGLSQAEAAAHIFDATLKAIAEREWYGGGLLRAFLPPLPVSGLDGGDRASKDVGGSIYEEACLWLSKIGCGQPLHGHPRHGMMRDTKHDLLAALAALMHGVTAGLGFASGLFLTRDARSGSRLTLRFIAGESHGAAYLGADAGVAKAVSTAVSTANAAAHRSEPSSFQPQGAFIWPVVFNNKVSAVVIATSPRSSEDLLEEKLFKFKELCTNFDEVLDGLGTPPFWE